MLGDLFSLFDEFENGADTAQEGKSLDDYEYSGRNDFDFHTNEWVPLDTPCSLDTACSLIQLSHVSKQPPTTTPVLQQPVSSRKRPNARKRPIISSNATDTVDAMVQFVRDSQKGADIPGAEYIRAVVEACLENRSKMPRKIKSKPLAKDTPLAQNKPFGQDSNLAQVTQLVQEAKVKTMAQQAKVKTLAYQAQMMASQTAPQPQPSKRPKLQAQSRSRSRSRSVAKPTQVNDAVVSIGLFWTRVPNDCDIFPTVIPPERLKQFWYRAAYTHGFHRPNRWIARPLLIEYLGDTTRLAKPFASSEDARHGMSGTLIPKPSTVSEKYPRLENGVEPPPNSLVMMKYAKVHYFMTWQPSGSCLSSTIGIACDCERFRKTPVVRPKNEPS